MKIPDDLELEAKAFDKRIRERVQNGHLPDLRRVTPCDWFYNNPWRRPEYVEMVFGEYLRFALEHLPPSPSKLLEVGSGPGHMVLELARHGYHVTGLELSADCIKVASRLLKENPYRGAFGSARYVRDDFMSWIPDRPYDGVCFFMSLHHFGNPAAVVAKAASLLAPGGVAIAIEPARDYFSDRNAAVAALIRLLLARSGCWYQRLDLPHTEEELAQYIQDCLDEYREARDKGEGEQSPKDNSSFAADILGALKAHFVPLACRPGYALVPRMVGGVRGPTEKCALELATFVRLFDEFCVKNGLLEPGVFYFAGRVCV